ncbi:YqeG family HAD IIIA-type phosphatase [Candidatus Saccharibacteria bacterium CPR2]|nr:YqeG family HAD IIIA-type phosphatase [Candidatus Saccharibacteria bacterium CPR2]
MERLEPKTNLLGKRSKLFVPDFFVKSVTEIEPRKLKNLGVSAVAFDVDSTLVAHGSKKFSPKIIKFLDEMRELDFIEGIALASNRSKNGLAKIAREHNFKLVHASLYSRKPSLSYYRRLSQILNVKPRQIAMVGDKLLQDVYGANKVGMVSILVEPLGPQAWYDALLMRRARQTMKLKRISRKQK